MGEHRRWWWIGIGVAALVVATGCGSQDEARDEAGVARPAAKQSATSAPPLAPTTTSVAAPATQAADTSDTTVAPRKAPATTVAPVRPAVTTTTTTVAPPVHDVVRPHEPEPTYEVDNPVVFVSPSRAPAGTRVFLDGTGFTGDHWESHGQLWLSIVGGQSSCYLVAWADSQIVIDDFGHLEGSFIVPEKGSCRFTMNDEMSTAGLDFQLAYQCTACFIGTFSVPPAPPTPEAPGVHCGTMHFSHGPVSHGSYYADGLPCDEARPVLADAWGWAPATGPQHVDVAGFSCDRIGESIGGAPTATYRCVKGAKSVTFIATGRS